VDVREAVLIPKRKRQVQYWNPRVRVLVSKIAAAKRWGNHDEEHRLRRELAQVRVELLQAELVAAARELEQLQEVS
jgi:hypothetical protein